MCYNRENKDKRFIMTKLYGSLEAGGTKFVCAVGDENFNIVEKTQFPTTTPIETIDKTIEFFSKFDNLAGLAIGSFGPIDIDKNSKTYGFYHNDSKTSLGKCRPTWCPTSRPQRTHVFHNGCK